MVAEQRRIGSGRCRRVGQQGPAVAVVIEIEAGESISAAEVQLRGVALAVLHRQHAEGKGNFLRRCGVDVVEVDGVICIELGEAADDALKVYGIVKNKGGGDKVIIGELNCGGGRSPKLDASASAKGGAAASGAVNRDNVAMQAHKLPAGVVQRAVDIKSRGRPPFECSGVCYNPCTGMPN
jgi:hypothetical protein